MRSGSGYCQNKLPPPLKRQMNIAWSAFFFSQKREEKRAKSSGKVNLEASHKKSTQIAVHTSNENNPTTGKHFSLTLERFYVLR